MKLCGKCLKALWDTLEREVSTISDFAFPDEQAFMLLMYFGIYEQDFYGAMRLRGWYKCERCDLWTQTTNDEGVCPECEKELQDEHD